MPAPTQAEKFQKGRRNQGNESLRGACTNLEYRFRVLGSNSRTQDSWGTGKAAKTKFSNGNFGRYWFFYSSPEMGETPLSHSQRKQPHLCKQVGLFRGKTHLPLLLNSC